MKITARIELPKKITAKFKELKMPLSGGYDKGYEDGYKEGFDEGRVDIPVITGDISYMFASGAWDWFLDMFGEDAIKTENITNARNVFYQYPKSVLPKIKFNLKAGAYVDFFFAESNIEDIDNYLEGITCGNMQNLFSYCKYLKTISNDFFNSMDLSKATSCAGVFNSCYSLRKIPDLRNFHNIPTSTTLYSSLFNGCYTVDEIVDIPVILNKADNTSNKFYSTFSTCKRAKDITFETNNGEPIVITRTCKSQTIDLSSNVGYNTGGKTETNIIGYNSGITSDKYVDNAEKFEELKNDPDWFGNLEYSRYNIDSAIRTIASLPDVSGGSSNVIKFKGTAGSGSASDGRTINQMTEEEIAVATAKGWTVSFA